MKVIKQTCKIKATLNEVWEAFTNSSYIEGWGAGPAKMDDKAGTKFSLWGGEIWGTNKEVLPRKKLVQEWYSKEDKKWDKPSIVTFTLKQDGDHVEVKLTQIDVPDEYRESVDKGWKEFYLLPLKKYLESK